ncbi:GNAT family N-acetyltransferase [Enterococcus faecalis]
MMSKYQLLLAENQTLQTERLWLRPVTLADTADMFAYASDEKCVEYVFPPHVTTADTKVAIASYFMAEPLGKYGLELKATGQMLGTIDLRVKMEKKVGELGYTLNREFWGQGFMPEAAEALLQLGFAQLELLRVFAVHDIDNQASGRVMEKIGMTIEGTIKNARISKGKIVTDVLRGITYETWQQRHVSK